MQTKPKTLDHQRNLPLYKILTLVMLFAFVFGMAVPAAQAQEPEPPEEPRTFTQVYSDDKTVTADQIGITAATTPTNSAGIATADPNGAHAVYAWPMVFNQMGHLMESYQNYGSSASGAYFHHGIDVITNNYGVNVYAVSGGQVVNVQNYNTSDLYWEVAILDPQGYVWQYHHIDKNTIPSAINSAFAAWQANHTTGGFIAARDLDWQERAVDRQHLWLLLPPHPSQHPGRRRRVHQPVGVLHPQLRYPGA